MHNHTVDILIPVWNNPFETRACIAAILEHSPYARLIVVANGSSRETELMLEEFSESLGERALFLLSDRNFGLVPAINSGLARSDSDYVVIVRPNVMVCQGWLDSLLKAAELPCAGLVTPMFYGEGMPQIVKPVKGCTHIETSSLSFSTLLIKGEMRMLIGNFDESLDGGEYCLLDYVLRAGKNGYRTYCSAQPILLCSKNNIFGSMERLQSLRESGKLAIDGRWGIVRHYSVYCGSEARASKLHELFETVLQQCRRGEKFTMLLHWRQYRECVKQGWDGVHTDLVLKRLPLFRAERNMANIHAGLSASHNVVVAVRGVQSVPYPGVTDAPYWKDLFNS